MTETTTPPFRLSSALAIAAMAGLLLSAGPKPAHAQGESAQAFMAACDQGIRENNPIWSADQRQRICECRYNYLSERLTDAQIATLSEHITSGAMITLPEELDGANLGSIEACMRQ